LVDKLLNNLRYGIRKRGISWLSQRGIMDGYRTGKSVIYGQQRHFLTLLHTAMSCKILSSAVSITLQMIGQHSSLPGAQSMISGTIVIHVGIVGSLGRFNLTGNENSYSASPFQGWVSQYYRPPITNEVRRASKRVWKLVI
jgi:hypothetical protein